MKDRLISGGRAVKQLLGRGGGDRFYPSIDLLWSVHVFFDAFTPPCKAIKPHNVSMQNALAS